MYCVNVSVHAHRRAVRKGGLCRAFAHRTRASPRLTLTRSERLSATCLLASYGERLHLNPLLTRRREQTSILAPDEALVSSQLAEATGRAEGGDEAVAEGAARDAVARAHLGLGLGLGLGLRLGFGLGF